MLLNDILHTFSFAVHDVSASYLYCTHTCSISGCAQIAIYLAHFVCGQTARPALKVVQLQLANVVVAWEALGKLGYLCSSSWG